MKSLKQNLYRQLISVAVIITGIIFISLGLFLPKVLEPFYEKTMYRYLEQPLGFINDHIDDGIFDDNVGYLYVTDEQGVVVSANLSSIIKLDPNEILSHITEPYGNFKYNGRTYYYNTANNKYVKKIALTNNDYILRLKRDVLIALIPILLITLLLISGLIILWTRRLVVKIEHLKEKVDNLDNDDYVDKDSYALDDELSALSIAIDHMKATLKEQEEYKNQMYQNISHDFKTPLTVIGSYIEAIEDGYATREEGNKIIKEQIQKLETKVHSLLYLNKLNYMKDIKTYTTEKADLSDLLQNCVDRFKVQRPDVSFEIHIEGKTIFRGTLDMWETIVENMLNNFVRYAQKEIKITIKNNKITFYNDGPNLDENILNDIFTPYKKGIKGQFGLGLSIIKKTLSLFGYEITVKNDKKGVSFIIK